MYQLQKSVYDVLQELRRRHEPATQLEVVSAALVVFANRPRDERERAITTFRDTAPSDTPPHEVGV